jgi:hypothetical protein
LEQGIQIRYEPPSQSAVQNTSTIGLPERLIRAPPAVGRVWNPDQPQDEMGDWDHLHLDLSIAVSNDPHGSEACKLMEHAFASMWGSRFEVAVDSATEPGMAARLAAIMTANRRQIARVLLYGTGPTAPEAADLQLWVGLLNHGGGERIPVFAAVRGYFVEFNRALDGTAAKVMPKVGMAFPLTATVHSDDFETVMSNVATIVDMSATVRALSGKSDIALMPLALYYPTRTEPINRLSGDELLRWMQSMLSNVVSAGITSLTVADDILFAFEASNIGKLRAPLIREWLTKPSV